MIHLNSTLFFIPSKSFASTKHGQYVTVSIHLPFIFVKNQFFVETPIHVFLKKIYL